MRTFGFVLLALTLIVLSSQVSQQKSTSGVHSYPEYSNPIRSAEEDLITELPGLKDPINFKQYSGYLRADNETRPTDFLHYYFVESQGNPAEDPLLLWLNGGPGCSSLLGLFDELGPFKIIEGTTNLQLNKYSWNKVANVLFLESPYDTGFSYSTRFIKNHNDDSTAIGNYIALKWFMQKFPQFKNHKLYLAGESYAGVYLPTLGLLVDADDEFKLGGVAIGNGYLDQAKLSDSLAFLSFYHGLTGRATWERVSEHCCGGRPPTREACQVSGFNLHPGCGQAVYEIGATLFDSGLNPYNFHSECRGDPHLPDGGKSRTRKEQIKEALRALNLLPALAGNITEYHSVYGAYPDRITVSPPCVDDSTIVYYMNDDAVKKALHVPKRFQGWNMCQSLVYERRYALVPGGMAPQIRQLIESDRNLTLLVYNGDLDLICNFLGNEWFMDDLGRELVADHVLWTHQGQVAGFVTHYNGISFATVKGAGHMVPSDKPQQSLKMIEAFLRSDGPNVDL